MSLPKKELLAQKLVHHGREIFAYSNVHTNQVVYSLDRSLNNYSAVKQLAYAGKNTVPANLRKDLWRPLWAASFPSQRQGLAAFRKLREWKRLHEVAWNPKDLPKLELTEEERLAQEKLHRQAREEGGRRIGGSRLRRTPYKKQRMLMIMDQKANSIADLAAVLLEQTEMGAELGEKRTAEDEKRQKKLYNLAVSLAKEAQNSGLDRLESQITAANTSLEALQSKPAEQRTKDDKEEARQLRRTLFELRSRRTKMEAVSYLVTEARTEHTRLLEEAQAEHKKTAGDKTTAPAFEKFDLATVLKDNIYGLSVFEETAPTPSPSKLPKRGNVRKSIKEALNPVPVFTPQGVRVRWANILDAEFAAEWPGAVEHGVLGLVRNTAPKTSDEAVLELEDRYVYDEEGRKMDDEEARRYLDEERRDEKNLPSLTPVLGDMKLDEGKSVSPETIPQGAGRESLRA